MKRIGLIVVDNNGGSEYDFWKMSPKGVGIFTTRMKMRESISPFLHEPKDIEEFKKELYEEASKIADLVDVIVYQRTFGTHKNIQIIRDILSSFNKPYVIAEESAIKIFKELEINKIWIFTPYGLERTLEEVDYFKDNGFDVTGYTYLGLKNGLEYSNVDYRTIFLSLLKSKVSKESEAIYLHCTNIVTYNAIKSLSRTYGIPILSENSASLILALRELELKEEKRKSIQDIR
ncbi:arylmalonate decarboxylase [Acidianus manzaensis]|uniref:Arylmalonate decarboxylase n=1 Tax=Acidianus manzaensis TaxID=282676 RepID=A0A1W6JYU8_9CREN|nr:arylmalonate decarboxylase [Acidianus manzaensis]ARM75374.1 hypothetical protein B6F84_04585 [Acidianus manzaensis]